MKRKYIALLMLMVFFATISTGCATSMDFSGQEETMHMDKELTQRQISILEEMGLPTDYEKLNIGQQSAIHAIEDLLTHLENTYKEEFGYLGYVADGGVDREHLIAYPLSGNKTDKVTLYRWIEDGKFLFQDNYTAVKARPLYKNAIDTFLKEYVEPAHMHTFCKVYNTKGDVTEENAPRNASATVYLFVDGDYVSEECCQELGDACKQWLLGNYDGLSCGILLMRTNTGEFYGITKENFEKKIWKDIFSFRTEYIINTDGKLRVLE